jgi:Histidine kinase
MPLHDFIFSGKSGKRLLRHLLFWLAWWFYFALCDYLYQLPAQGLIVKPIFINTGSNLLIKTFLLVGVYAIACYTILYYLMPAVIKKGQLIIVLLLLPLAGFLYGTVYILFWIFFPYIDTFMGATIVKYTGIRIWPPVYLGLITPLKVIAAAVAIKYVKYWWLKQKESERLQKDKLKAELQLLKAQVHPDFLFKTLNNIYAHAQSSSLQTPAMILKLSDLLSYMLYDCSRPVVPLKNEIEMMKEYMQLEKKRHNDVHEMEVNIKGELIGLRIAPFLLLPFIENSFKYSSELTEQVWINMDILVESENFSMKLTNGISKYSSGYSFGANGLSNVQKRLNLLYPGNYELKITAEHEMLIVLLNIKLNSAPVNIEENNELHSITVESEK